MNESYKLRQEFATQYRQLYRELSDYRERTNREIAGLHGEIAELRADVARLGAIEPQRAGKAAA